MSMWTQTFGQVQGIDLLGNRSYVEIPFRVEQGFIIIKTRFHNSINLDFIFDTGAENIIIFDREIPEIFGIPYDRRIRIMGSDLNQGLHAKIIRNVFFKIGESHIVKRDAVVLEENILQLEERLGINVGGIIGGSFFRNLVVEVNYSKKRLRLYHPSKLDRKKFSSYQKFDLEMLSSKPYLKANTTLMNGQDLELTFLLDAGASLPFLIHTDTNPLLTIPEHVKLGSLGFGITGMLRGYIGQVKKLELGSFTFDDVVTSFQEVSIQDERSSNILIRNGIIGNELLKRFHFVIDYFEHKAYFKPRRKRKYSRPFNYDRSGLVVFAVGIELNEYLIKDVIPDTPGEEGDIQPGDMLIKIRNRRTSQMHLEDVNALLQGKVGKKVKMELIRDGERIMREIILRDWYKR